MSLANLKPTGRCLKCGKEIKVRLFLCEKCNLDYINFSNEKMKLIGPQNFYKKPLGEEIFVFS